MELTNNSSLKNFIGCSRTLRSMNSCYFFEDIENDAKILYRFPPQSFFFCEDEKNVVDFVRLHQMMSTFINCRGQLTDDIAISVGCLILLSFCQIFFCHAKKLKHKNIFCPERKFISF